MTIAFLRPSSFRSSSSTLFRIVIALTSNIASKENLNIYFFIPLFWLTMLVTIDYWCNYDNNISNIFMDKGLSYFDIYVFKFVHCVSWIDCIVVITHGLLTVHLGLNLIHYVNLQDFIKLNTLLLRFDGSLWTFIYNNCHAHLDPRIYQCCHFWVPIVMEHDLQLTHSLWSSTNNNVARFIFISTIEKNHMQMSSPCITINISSLCTFISLLWAIYTSPWVGFSPQNL